MPWRLYRPTRETDDQSDRALAVRRRIAVEVRKGLPHQRIRAIRQLKAEGELEDVPEHPLLDFLARGNPYMIGLHIDALTTMYLDTVGEAYWLFERDGLDTPTQRLPIPKHWVKTIPSPKSPYYELDFLGWQGKIPMTEMVRFAEPNLGNPYGRGVGTARALDDELQTDEMAAKHTAAWFKNRGRPDLMIFGKGMNPDDAKRLERSWQQRFGGFMRAYRPAFLGGEDVTIKELNQSFQNMQLVELRQFERDTIHQVYGVPPEVLGIVESSNRATIEAADYIFSRWVLLPRLEYQAAVVQESIVPLFDEGLIFGFENPVADDKEHQLKVASNAPYAFKVNEHREMAGLAPLDGEDGELFPVPLSVSFKETLVPQEVPPALVPPADDEETPASEPDPDPEGDDQADDAGEVENDGVAVDRLVAGRIKDEWTASPIDENDAGYLAALIASDEIREAIMPTVQRTYSHFGEDALDLVDPDAEFVTNQRVIDYLRERGHEHTDLINETTRDLVRGALVAGVERGEGIDGLAERVKRVFAGCKEARAEEIARTEVVAASNAGALEGYKQGGLREKDWLSTRDGRTREAHVEIDGQRRAIEVDFSNSLGQGPCPGQMGGGAENNVRCRCTIMPVVDGRAQATDEETKAAVWRAFDRQRYPFEAEMREALRPAFARQEAEVLSALYDLVEQRSVARV